MGGLLTAIHKRDVLLAQDTSATQVRDSIIVFSFHHGMKEEKNEKNTDFSLRIPAMHETNTALLDILVVIIPTQLTLVLNIKKTFFEYSLVLVLKNYFFFHTAEILNDSGEKDPDIGKFPKKIF